MTFPKDFVWGAAAASFQIEGSTEGVDGCGASVWDMVCRREGFVKAGDNGSMACNHYQYYKDDVAIMKNIGIQAYRLSVMWPRVMPNGTGKVNAAGLSFYDKLVDELLAAGIEPWVTLFHWDMPLELYYRGGWLNEDSSDWFADYAQVVVEKLSDRVKHWFTLNETAVFIGLGHQDGIHAPGLKLPLKEVNRAWHNTLLAHGKAVRVIRELSPQPALIGSAPCFHNTIPASPSQADIEAARQAMFAMDGKHMFTSSWWLDPILQGHYPADGLALFGSDAPTIKAGDMDVISQPVDFIGYNIYQSRLVKANAEGQPETQPYPNDYPCTHFGWPITPEALLWSSKFLYERYQKPIYVTENGLSVADWVSVDGKVHDPQRIDFLTRYLAGAKQAINQGVDLRGYFQWSIMDNFEWAEGYRQRFGLVHVDFKTHQRTIKDSGYWYRDLIQCNGASIKDILPTQHWPK